MHSKSLKWPIVIVFLNYLIQCNGNDSPGFFLRINKNIPRLGRQTVWENDAYDIYGQLSKTKPKDTNQYTNTLNHWLWNEMVVKPTTATATATATTIKRFNEPTKWITENDLTIVQPINANTNTLIELIDRQIIPTDNMKFIHWKDFDLALQLDNELYEKIILLGRKPDQRLKADLTIDAINDYNFHSYHDDVVN